MAHKQWSRPVRMGSSSAVVADHRGLYAMSLVTAFHVAALFWLMHPWTAAPTDQPVISFTVTMMDLSSSHSNVSSAASAASMQAEKQAIKPSEELKPDAHTAKVKKAVKAAAQPIPQSNAQQSHNSQEQTAVLSPTTPAQFDAAYLQNPAPVYPSLSRRMGEQGNIFLNVYVDEQGRAGQVQLKKSSGFDRLDTAAVEAVKRWRFASAKQDGQMVASWVQVPVKFVLE